VEDSFGRLARTAAEGGLSLALELHVRFRLVFHGRLTVDVHRVDAFANRVRVALAKDLNCLRLQVFDGRRLHGVKNPELEFRDFGWRRQLFEM
jgi:hypothetical protein